jgi:hypothetical protein
VEIEKQKYSCKHFLHAAASNAVGLLKIVDSNVNTIIIVLMRSAGVPQKCSTLGLETTTLWHDIYKN